MPKLQKNRHVTALYRLSFLSDGHFTALGGRNIVVWSAIMCPRFVSTVYFSSSKHFTSNYFYIIILIVQSTPNTWRTNCCKSENNLQSFQFLLTCLWRIISHFESCLRCTTKSLSPIFSLTDLTGT